MSEGKIITSHDYPPIPIRDYDWSAIREDYEPGDPIGTGRTEQDAINDLVACEGERKLDTESKCNMHDVSTRYLREKENGDLDCPVCGAICGFSWHNDYEKDDKVLCTRCDEHYIVP